jgi:hypothetical protein
MQCVRAQGVSLKEEMLFIYILVTVDYDVFIQNW